MDAHPVMGQFVGSHRIYTRTVVVYLVNVQVNLPILEQNVEVSETGPVAEPRVVMIQYQKRSDGFLQKRKDNQRRFFSMLTLDVACQNKTPHLKLSRQNTIHVTGCCDMDLLQRIISHLLQKYENRGFQCGANHGFVLDIVMSNLSFQFVLPDQPGASTPHTGRQRDIFLTPHQLRKMTEAINADVTTDGCIWTAILKNKQNTLNIIVYRNNPDSETQGGEIYPFYADNTWTMLDEAAVFNRFNIRMGFRSRNDSFRIFQTGSVVHVGRWPFHMYRLQQKLLLITERVLLTSNRERAVGIGIRQHAQTNSFHWPTAAEVCAHAAPAAAEATSSGMEAPAGGDLPSLARGQTDVERASETN
jgi:hypothetical protein